jgi:hypothetical protein
MDISKSMLAEDVVSSRLESKQITANYKSIRK